MVDSIFHGAVGCSVAANLLTTRWKIFDINLLIYTNIYQVYELVTNLLFYITSQNEKTECIGCILVHN